ncbi:MAG: hypothetical protein HY907_08545 [Deltaproteobacteria bacterium]|nr:hypothetical protein [Deltaproteobacteria bacterium]
MTAFLAAALAAAPAGAQWTEVTPGAAAEAPAEGQTELSFSSEDTGLSIRIVDGGPGRIPERDCRTPCRFRLTNGNYTLHAGDHEFQVAAGGGHQHWLVEDDSGSWLAVGIIGIVVGAAATGVGTWGVATLASEHKPDRDWLIGASVATGAGGLALVGGIVAVALSFGSAEMISFSPTIDEAATLSPSLAYFPLAGEKPGWGLSLALHL